MSDSQTQRDEEWLQKATKEQIAAAFDAGELDVLLGRRPHPTEQLKR
jgi:hypothetical protein